MKDRMELLTNEEMLKDKLMPIREACPLLLDVFIWRQDVYPAIIASTVTLIFGTLWYLDPSILTSLSILGLILTSSDFLLPFLLKSSSSFPDDWTSEKEKKFCIFANRIAYYSVQLWNIHVSLKEWKRERPNIHASCVVISLLFLAWIGNAINNLLLAYFAVLFLALLPGLLHRRILHNYFYKTTLTTAQFLGIKHKKT